MSRLSISGTNRRIQGDAPVKWGRTSIALTGASTNLTAAQVSYRFIELTGALAANHTLNVPQVDSANVDESMWVVTNNTTGNYTLTWKHSSGVGSSVVIAQGCTAFIWTDGTSMYTITDTPMMGAMKKSRSAIAITDANYNLSYAEVNARSLAVTGTITAQRNLVLPSLAYGEWVLFNNCTGAFGLQLIGPSGTGVVVANAKRAILECDGTNVVRITADT